MSYTESFGDVMDVSRIDVEATREFDALIMAGGEGSRFRDGREPKVLQEVGGKPPMNHTIEALRDIGINNLYVSTGGPHEEDIEAHVEGIAEAEPVRAGETTIKSLDKARYRSFRAHREKVNEEFEENGLPVMAPDSVFGDELNDKDGSYPRSQLHYARNTQPKLMTLMGDSVYPRKAIEFTKEAYIPKYTYSLGNRWYLEHMISLGSSVEDSEVDPDAVKDFLDMDLRDFMRLQNASKPFLHLMNTNKDDTHPVPEFEPISDLTRFEGETLTASLGNPTGFTRETDKRIGISIFDPWPFDYKIKEGGEDPVTERVDIPRMESEGYISHLYELEASRKRAERLAEETEATLPGKLGIGLTDSMIFLLESDIPYLDINDEEDLEEARRKVDEGFLEEGPDKEDMEEFRERTILYDPARWKKAGGGLTELALVRNKLENDFEGSITVFKEEGGYQIE